MKRIFVFMIAALLLSTITFGAAQAQTTTSAQGVLLAYYTSINLRDYRSAYNLWINPRQTYQNFASGFANTDHVEPYFGALQAPHVAGELGRVPMVLLGYNTNGTVSSFFGCFTLSSGYRISGATIHTISSNGIPDNTSIVTALGVNCSNLPASLPMTFLDTSSPAYGLVWSYFRAINQRDYSTAYADWLQPIPGPKPNGQPATDYRPNYNQYVSGYSDTVYIDVYPGAYNETGASAGHGYLDGVMPLVLVGQRTNGSITAYYGCLVIGGFPDGHLGIVSGKFYTWLNNLPIGASITQLNTIDCTRLNLQY